MIPGIRRTVKEWRVSKTAECAVHKLTVKLPALCTHCKRSFYSIVDAKLTFHGTYSEGEIEEERRRNEELATAEAVREILHSPCPGCGGRVARDRCFQELMGVEA